jgi:AhpD family alkylhydroperoxidase
MSKRNPREILQEYRGGFKDFMKDNRDTARAIINQSQALNSEGALTVREKELISVAIGLHIRCEYCVAIHVYECFRAGASREEILEAGLVAVSMGGGPVLTYFSTLLHDCVNEFEKDFIKE